MSSQHATSDCGQLESGEPSDRALSSLVSGYVSNSISLVNAAVSNHGTTYFGSKSLSELRDSVDRTVAKGTALITTWKIDNRCPGLLLYPEGSYEVLSSLMERAYIAQHKPTVLLHRTLQSLNGVPTPLSTPDYETLVGMLRAAQMSDNASGRGVFGSLGGYDLTLKAVQSARERQLSEGGEDGNAMFDLDLRAVPFSIGAPRRSGWSTRKEPGKELGVWAGVKMREAHQEDPGTTTVVLELKDPRSQSAFFFNDSDTRRKLTKKIRHTAEESYHLFQVERICTLDDTLAGRHTYLDFTPRDDEASKRFARTAQHAPEHELWMYDTFLATAAKQRALSKLETHSLVAPKLRDQYCQSTDEKGLFEHSAYTPYASSRPSDYIQYEDKDFKQWKNELLAANQQSAPLKWTSIPYEGHASLLDDVNLIIEDDKGLEVYARRYGEGNDIPNQPATIAEMFEDAEPLEYFLTKSHRDSHLSPEELEGEMPPAAFEKWTELKEGQAGTDTEGKDVRDYQKYLMGYLEANPDARSMSA